MNNETILEECRNNFKKLEDGDPYCIELWNRFKEVSLKDEEIVKFQARRTVKKTYEDDEEII